MTGYEETVSRERYEKAEWLLAEARWWAEQLATFHGPLPWHDGEFPWETP